MSKVAHYNNTTGEILGFYDDEIHSVIPSPTLDLTYEQWGDCIENPGLRKVDAVDLIIITIEPDVDIDRIKQTSLINIDNAAENVRLIYITGGVGQALTYQEKAKQAESYIAAGYPLDTSLHLLVQAEANASNTTPTDAADAIIILRDIWLTKAAAIEETRRTGKILINNATTVASVESIHDNAVQALELIGTEEQ